MLMIRTLCFALLVAACGGKQTPDPGPGPGDGSGSAEPVGVVTDTRPEAVRRRDEGCEVVGRRVTACAVEEAKADHAAGKVSKQDFEANTSPAVLEKHTADFVDNCKKKVPASTYHVRVLEVCPAEETECGPMLSCLENLNKAPAKQPSDG